MRFSFHLKGLDFLVSPDYILDLGKWYSLIAHAFFMRGESPHTPHFLIAIFNL